MEPTATNAFNISWDAPKSAANYNLYRDGMAIATNIKTTSYEDSGSHLEVNEAYTYKVEAINGTGTSNKSSGTTKYTLSGGIGQTILKSKTNTSITLQIDKASNENTPQYKIVAKESDT